MFRLKQYLTNIKTKHYLQMLFFGEILANASTKPDARIKA
jgi:hypothetical protein